MAFLAQIIWMILTTISNATASPREIEMERMISVSGSPGQSGNSGQSGQSGHSAQAGHSRGFSEEWLNWELIDTKTKKKDHKLLWYTFILADEFLCIRASPIKPISCRIHVNAVLVLTVRLTAHPALKWEGCPISPLEDVCLILILVAPNPGIAREGVQKIVCCNVRHTGKVSNSVVRSYVYAMPPKIL